MNLNDLCAPPSAGSIELAIDLSNVCRNYRLDSTGDVARWDRVLRVLQIWNEWPDAFERPVVLLIADTSLRFSLTPEDAKELDRAVRDGFAVETPKADPALLDLAEKCDCTILSNDNFVSYRRERPWMEEADSRFVQIRTTGTTAHLEVVKLRKRSSFSKSRAEEQDKLKDLRIDVERDLGSELLRSVYRCDSPTCLRRRFLPDGAVSTPERNRSGAAVCPGCRQPLTRVGDAQRTAVIKIFGLHSGEASRIPIAVGQSVTVGRASGDLSLADVLPEGDLQRISREHLRVRFDTGGLVVTDLGSTNGSILQRWDKSRRERTPAIRLLADSPVGLGPRDLVVLAEVLCLERSGRRFPFDLEPISPSGLQTGVAPKTVIRTGEEF